MDADRPIHANQMLAISYVVMPRYSITLATRYTQYTTPGIHSRESTTKSQNFRDCSMPVIVAVVMGASACFETWCSGRGKNLPTNRPSHGNNDRPHDQHDQQRAEAVTYGKDPRGRRPQS
jgi:hypothetical protein